MAVLWHDDEPEDPLAGPRMLVSAAVLAITTLGLLAWAVLR